MAVTDQRGGSCREVEFPRGLAITGQAQYENLGDCGPLAGYRISDCLSHYVLLLWCSAARRRAWIRRSTVQCVWCAAADGQSGPSVRSATEDEGVSAAAWGAGTASGARFYPAGLCVSGMEAGCGACADFPCARCGWDGDSTGAAYRPSCLTRWIPDEPGENAACLLAYSPLTISSRE